MLVSKFLLVIMALMAMSVSVLAQEDDAAPMSREDMQTRIEDVRKMKLIDLLQLKDEQVEKFFVLYNSTHSVVLQRLRDMNDAAEKLKRMSRDNDTKLQLQIDAMQKATKDLHAAVEQRNARMKDVLSLHQYGTYLAFEAKFQDELAKVLIKRAKEKGPRGGRRNRD
ncbi:MAG: biliverdin-producing heme oxygenase [Ignavibacteria bacterium]|nr:biliverdin-producing heme oxygenase [Ignavibacteria bacterium]